MSTEDPYKHKVEEPEKYRKGIWGNQARINFELVRTNKKLIEALQTLIKLLQADRSVQGLKPVDLTAFGDLLEEATKIATAVAGIDPPGCQGPPPY